MTEQFVAQAGPLEVTVFVVESGYQGCGSGLVRGHGIQTFASGVRVFVAVTIVVWRAKASRDSRFVDAAEALL